MAGFHMNATRGVPAQQEISPIWAKLLLEKSSTGSRIPPRYLTLLPPQTRTLPNPYTAKPVQSLESSPRLSGEGEKGKSQKNPSTSTGITLSKEKKGKKGSRV
jgi:hypothetical protein